MQIAKRYPWPIDFRELEKKNSRWLLKFATSRKNNEEIIHLNYNLFLYNRKILNEMRIIKPCDFQI